MNPQQRCEVEEKIYIMKMHEKEKAEQRQIEKKVTKIVIGAAVVLVIAVAGIKLYK